MAEAVAVVRSVAVVAVAVVVVVVVGCSVPIALRPSPGPSFVRYMVKGGGAAPAGRRNGPREKVKFCTPVRGRRKSQQWMQEEERKEGRKEGRKGGTLVNMGCMLLVSTLHCTL
jgi:hypothetical protein